tara:strand:+ start:1968 stop:2240 length:273 start_codon:yes stop_codon:yes gene_type:complete
MTKYTEIIKKWDDKKPMIKIMDVREASNADGLVSDSGKAVNINGCWYPISILRISDNTNDAHNYNPEGHTVWVPVWFLMTNNISFESVAI